MRATVLAVQRCLPTCVAPAAVPLDFSNCCSRSNSCNHFAFGPRNGMVPGFVLALLFLPSSFPFRLVMCSDVFFFCTVIPACHLRCRAQCRCPATAGCEHLHFFPSFLVHLIVIWYNFSPSNLPCSSPSTAIPPPSSSSRLSSPFGSSFSQGTRAEDVARRRLRARAGHRKSSQVHVCHVEGPGASKVMSCERKAGTLVAAWERNLAAGARACRGDVGRIAHSSQRVGWSCWKRSGRIRDAREGFSCRL